MKTTFVLLSVCCFVLIFPTACNPQPTVSPIAPSSPAPTQSDADKQAQLEQQGVYNADTLEEASMVVGFQVIAPSFIPDGFSRGGKIMITLIGGALPEGMTPKFYNSVVRQTWIYDNDRSSSFVLTQSQRKFGIGGAETAEICGKPGQRLLSPVEGTEDKTPVRLTLGWSDANLFYSLSGTLKSPLNEDVITKIVCSVGVR